MKDIKDIDLELLQDLLSKCEDSMGRPFKKKKVEVEVKAEPEEESEVELDSDDEDSSMEDMDLQDLIEMYKQLKD